MKSLLEKQLAELSTIRRAPALWKVQTRESLLAQISNQSTEVLSWSEKFNVRMAEFQLRLAPLALKPVLATLAVLLVIGVPVAQATYQSLPGSALYTLKRGAERLQVALALTPEQEGLSYLNQAQKRVNELNRATSISAEAQAKLLRDYNTSLSLAQAVYKSANLNTNAINQYDASAYLLLDNLRRAKVVEKVQPLYATAIGLSERVAQESVVLLVQAHQAGSNGLPESEVAQRLNTQITSIENKLTVVQNRVSSLPQNKPSPKVLIESKQTILQVREAPRVAIAALAQAKELVEKKEFTQALQKVVEGDEITEKTEAAVTKSEADDKKDETVKSDEGNETAGSPPAGGKGEADVKPSEEKSKTDGSVMPENKAVESK